MTSTSTITIKTLRGAEVRLDMTSSGIVSATVNGALHTLSGVDLTHIAGLGTCIVLHKANAPISETDGAAVKEFLGSAAALNAEWISKEKAKYLVSNDCFSEKMRARMHNPNSDH